MAEFKIPHLKVPKRSGVKELQNQNIHKFDCDKLPVHKRIAQGSFGEVYTTSYQLPGKDSELVVIKNFAGPGFR